MNTYDPLKDFETSIESDWSITEFDLGKIVSEYRHSLVSIKRMDNMPYVKPEPVLGHFDQT
jgi:hypothetical protein